MDDSQWWQATDTSNVIFKDQYDKMNTKEVIIYLNIDITLI